MEEENEDLFFLNFESVYDDTPERIISKEQVIEPLNVQTENWFLKEENFEELTDENSHVLKKVIEYYYLKENYEKSLKFCEIFITKKNENSKLKYTKELEETTCRVYMKCKKFKEALDLFDNSTILHRSSILSLKGKCHQEMENYEEAIKLYQEAIFITNSKSPSYLTDLSLCFEKVNRKELSILISNLDNFSFQKLENLSSEEIAFFKKLLKKIQ
eukprot:gene1986-1494_t